MEFIKKFIGQEALLWNRVEKDIPIIFWGCGNNAKIVSRLLEKKGIYPTVYCDSNPQMIGEKIDGVEVLSYQQVKERFEKYYIVLTVAIHNAKIIAEQLKKKGEKNPIIHVEKPFKVDDEWLEYDYLKANIKQFAEVYGFLGDEISQEIFEDNINFRLSGDKLRLLKYVDGDTFFDEKLIPKSEHYSYVDVGAYTGDTLLRFYAFCAGKYDRIYAVEPDKENFRDLESLVRCGRLEDVVLYNVGGWDCKDELVFYTAKNKNKRKFDSPNFFKNMSETMPSYCGIGEEEFLEEKIAVDTVDNLLAKTEGKCDLIKINALAADFQSLRGSKKTIEHNKPIIVGEYGTRKENLTDMLRYIIEINPAYKIYLRQKMIFGDCKTVFIAISESIK